MEKNPLGPKGLIIAVWVTAFLFYFLTSFLCNPVMAPEPLLTAQGIENILRDDEAGIISATRQGDVEALRGRIVDLNLLSEDIYERGFLKEDWYFGRNMEEEFSNRISELVQMAEERIALLTRLEEIRSRVERWRCRAERLDDLDRLRHELQDKESELERRYENRDPSVYVEDTTDEGLEIAVLGGQALINQIRALIRVIREASRECSNKSAQKARDAIGQPPKDGIEFVEHNPCRDKQAVGLNLEIGALKKLPAVPTVALEMFRR